MKYNNINSITKGVMIYCAPTCSISNRVYFSRGTELANSNDFMEGSYRSKQEWRKPSKKEIDILFTNVPINDYNLQVSILKIPNKLKDIFIKSKIGESKTNEEARKTLSSINKDLAKDINDGLKKFTESIATNNNNKRIHGLFVGQPDCLGVGRYSPNHKLMGLHFDRNKPYKDYSENPNRVSINIGFTDRFLLFINKTTMDIKNMLTSIKSYNFDEFDEEQLCKEFLYNFPDYPVIKVRIKPYEAYIAPTNNIIHDGTTIGNLGNDVTLVLVGHFNVNTIH